MYIYIYVYMYAFDYIQLSNVTCTNYFTTFLQTINVENSYYFLYKATTNITFYQGRTHSTQKKN